MTADQAMIWFGVIIAMNLQTSFLTPPFGFALFYLRSVAAKADYKDRITGQTIPAVQTMEIYKGAVAFIVLQVIMVVMVMLYPGLVTSGMDEGVKLDATQVLEQMQMEAAEEAASRESDADGNADGENKDGAPDKEEDPMKALLESMARDKK